VNWFFEFVTLVPKTGKREIRRVESVWPYQKSYWTGMQSHGLRDLKYVQWRMSGTMRRSLNACRRSSRAEHGLFLTCYLMRVLILTRTWRKCFLAILVQIQRKTALWELGEFWQISPRHREIAWVGIFWQKPIVKWNCNTTYSTHFPLR